MCHLPTPPTPSGVIVVRRKSTHVPVSPAHRVLLVGRKTGKFSRALTESTTQQVTLTERAEGNGS